MNVILFIFLLFNLGALFWYALNDRFSLGNFLGVILMVAALTIGD